MVLAPSAMSSTSQKECVKRAVNCGRIQSCSKGTERPKGFFFYFFLEFQVDILVPSGCHYIEHIPPRTPLSRAAHNPLIAATNAGSIADLSLGLK